MYFHQAKPKTEAPAPQPDAGDWFLRLNHRPGAITCTTQARLRTLPREADNPRRPAHPDLVKIAFTVKGKRGKSSVSPSQREQRARKMEWALQTLADGAWRELPGADAPPNELLNRGYVEEEREGLTRRYRITKTGLRLHRKVQAVPRPKSQAEVQAHLDWQREFSLLMCLG